VGYPVVRTGHIPDRLDQGLGNVRVSGLGSFLHCARRKGNNLQAPAATCGGAAARSSLARGSWIPKRENPDLGYQQFLVQGELSS